MFTPIGRFACQNGELLGNCWGMCGEFLGKYWGIRVAPTLAHPSRTPRAPLAHPSRAPFLGYFRGFPTQKRGIDNCGELFGNGWGMCGELLGNSLGII